MKIAVCVKHVPDGRVRMDGSTKQIDRSGSGQLNVFDTNAVEEALQLSSEADSPEVVVITMGPRQAEDALRSALALGADRAVHIHDPSASGSDLVATSRVLSVALGKEGPDLVLFGQQASDGGGALLWAAVADRLQWPVISQVTELTVEDGSLRATRQTEFGDEVIEARMPAVVAVTDAINEPRYASLRGMMAAKRKPLEEISLASLGIDPSLAGERGSLTTVLDLGQPPARAGGSTITEDVDAAQAIVDYLVERDLL
jgi:electron transfer flavoprotein beta subunit